MACALRCRVLSSHLFFSAYQRDLDEVSDFGTRDFDEASDLLTRSLLYGYPKHERVSKSRSVHWRFDDDADTAVQRAIGDHLKIKLPTPSEIHKKRVQKMVEWFKYPGMRFILKKKKKKKCKRDLDEVDDLDARDFDAPYDLEARHIEVLTARGDELELSDLVARKILENLGTEFFISSRAPENRHDFDEGYGLEVRDIGIDEECE
ncbi:unnamed protein product [Clonostachys rhizophaga]|uniref:Uncharacterized protein n=1 Tax=Clonostachys rhizophaga TaxID=160324 RepID=A0A9N9YLX7_9HYPO|nr:unnamed protein product [Clonostachys rhizophaga]